MYGRCQINLGSLYFFSVVRSRREKCKIKNSINLVNKNTQNTLCNKLDIFKKYITNIHSYKFNKNLKIPDYITLQHFHEGSVGILKNFHNPGKF